MEKESTISRIVSRWRSSLVLVGSLIALLVLGGPLQVVSLQPAEVQAQPISVCTAGGVENDPTAIVQDCDLRLGGFIDLEAQAVDTLLAIHQLPASDADRVRAWERDSLRALMFLNLVGMIEKDPADRSLAEQAIVDSMAAHVQGPRLAAAQYSLDQYNLWSADPCNYQAPHGFIFDGDVAWCSSPLIQLTRDPVPPPLEDFLKYGFAEVYEDMQHGSAGEYIAREMAKVLGIAGGVVASGIAVAVGGAIGSTLSATSGVISAMLPFLKVAAASVVPGAAAFAIGTIVLFVIIAVVTIIVQAIAVVSASEIPVQLQEGLNQAQAGVDLQQLAQSEEGLAEIYSAFVLSTLPDFPNTGSIPAQQATDRNFIITDSLGNQTESQTIHYQCWNPQHCAETDQEHSARIHAGWFVDRSDQTGAERMTLEIEYVDWNGDEWTAARIGPQEFLHTRVAEDVEEYVSEEIKYQDPSGVPLTAVMNHPPSTPPTPTPDDTVNNGVFALEWAPTSIDPEGEQVTYTLFRCDASELSFINGVQTCTESVVATGLTTTSYEFTASVPEEDGLLKYRVVASDGNIQSASSAWSEEVLVDQRPPAITFLSRTPLSNHHGWNNTDVTFEWTCVDTEPNAFSRPSGVVNETVTVTVTTEGHNQTVTGVCADQAGNTAANTIGGSQFDQISIDKTAPEALFDGPYVVDEGGSIQISGAPSNDPLSGLEVTMLALDGDDVFDDIDPSTFAAIDGPSVHPVKLRVQDRAGNVTIAETTVTVQNVAPTIDTLTTNGPVVQGQQAQVNVTASDVGGIHDPLRYAFDCDNDGIFEVGPQTDAFTACILDPGAMISTIGVKVMDDDAGETVATVDVEQILTLCVNRSAGTVRQANPNGTCNSGTIAVTVSEATTLTFCVNRYSQALRFAANGQCGGSELAHIAPVDGPLFYCESRWTGELRYSRTGQCGAYENAGVIPGTVL